MDKVLLCVLFFVLAGGDVLSSEIPRKKEINKIVGGQITPIEKLPYQVYLAISNGTNTGSCGGSIISGWYILTAAHCIYGTVANITVVAGTTNGTTGRQIYIVKKSSSMIKHPNYNRRTYDYDVALLKLDKKINMTGPNIKAINLTNTNDVPDGEDVIVSGWGDTSENGALSPNLRSVILKIVPQNECNKKYVNLTDRMFCAGIRRSGKDACQGDSGGPAVLKSSGKLVGIISHGRGCARPNIPGVYSRVGNPAIRRWIRRTANV